MSVDCPVFYPVRIAALSTHAELISLVTVLILLTTHMNELELIVFVSVKSLLGNSMQLPEVQ